jgi:hypothetical protein
MQTSHPEYANEVAERFAEHPHHILGTIRIGGSPRLSGTEVNFEGERITIGMMLGAHKLDDVRRDHRVEIHTPPVDEELRRADVKLTGRVVELGPIIDEGQHEGVLFELDLERTSIVRVVDGQLEFRVWTRTGGLCTMLRS